MTAQDCAAIAQATWYMMTAQDCAAIAQATWCMTAQEWLAEVQDLFPATKAGRNTQMNM